MTLSRPTRGLMAVALCGTLASCASLSSAGQSVTSSPSTTATTDETGLSVVESVANPVGSVIWAIRSIQVMRSTDDGATWVDVTPGKVTAVFGYFVLNDAQAYIATPSTSGDIVVFVTRDGGVSWSPSSIHVDNAAGGWNSVFLAMADENRGLLSVETMHGASTAEVVLFRTNDGGSSWTQLGTQELVGPLAFSDANHVWAPAEPEGQALLESDDDGATWSPVTLPLPASNEFTTIGTPQFYASAGVVLAMQGQTLLAFYSADAGGTWTKLNQTITDSRAALPAAFVPFALADPNHIYVGFRGQLLETGVNASSWSPVGVPVPGFITSVDGFDDQAAATLQQSSCSKSANSCSVASNVVETANAGASWNVANPPPVTSTN
jgi:hypothetical protein